MEKKLIIAEWKKYKKKAIDHYDKYYCCLMVELYDFCCILANWLDDVWSRRVTLMHTKN